MISSSVCRPIVSQVARNLASIVGGSSGIIPPSISNLTAFWPFGDAINTPLHDLSNRGNTGRAHNLPGICSEEFRIGANANGGQTVFGRLAMWGTWKRLLTAGEKAALYGGEKWPFSTTTSLQDAAAYFLLGEASNAATYTDSANAQDLTRVGATTQVTGPLGVGNATQFAGATYLARAASDSLQTGNETHTICGWVNLDNLVAVEQQLFYGQIDLSALNIGTCIYYHRINGRFQADLGGGDESTTPLAENAVVVANNFGAISTGTWYFLCAEYDKDQNTWSLSVNGTADTLDLSRLPRPGASDSPAGKSTVFGPSYPLYSPSSGWDATGASRYSVPATSDVTFGNRDRMVWGWVKVTDSATQTIAGYYKDDVANIDWLVQYAGGLLYFLQGNMAGTFWFSSASVTLNTWNFFVMWFAQSGDGKLHVDVNNGAIVPAPVTPTGTPAEANAPILFGGQYSPPTTSAQFTGELSAWGMASKIPTAGEISDLYAYRTALGPV